MLNRPDDNAYNRRQNSRLMVTTIEAITMVAASSVGKFPASVAPLMTAPNPVVVMVWPWKWKYSATILAFHAPPDAVTKPVIRYGKIPGRSNFRQRSTVLRRNTSQTSLRSVGMADAPAMTLKRMYHCVPMNSRTMEPTPSPPPKRIKASSTMGNNAVAGTDAAILGIGWAVAA